MSGVKRGRFQGGGGNASFSSPVKRDGATNNTRLNREMEEGGGRRKMEEEERGDDGGEEEVGEGGGGGGGGNLDAPPASVDSASAQPFVFFRRRPNSNRIVDCTAIVRPKNGGHVKSCHRRHFNSVVVAVAVLIHNGVI